MANVLYGDVSQQAVRRFLSVSVVLLALVAAWSPRATAAPAPCFLKNGDIWLFHGDSITHADTYRRICERVFRHYHPEGNVEFIQAGVWGSSSSDLAKRLQEQKRKPTVVSLMLGMNNAINGGWVKGLPRDTHLANYRRDIEDFVRKSRVDGAAVILMSPTLTDDSTRQTFFRIEGAIDFLQDCRKIVQEVAAKEGAFYVPVQEELEAFQNTLDFRQKLRPDGVHPASLGEYQIARSLWERLNFAGAITNKPERALVEMPERLAVTLRPDTVRLDASAAVVTFNLASATTERAEINWSLAGRRSKAAVELGQATRWTLVQMGGLTQQKAGQAMDAVIEVRAGDRSALFIVDFCTVPVLHFQNDEVSGSIAGGGEAARPVAKWSARRDGNELLITVDVNDGKIESSAKSLFASLFQRDGVNVHLDLRPDGRFGDINLDTDVHQAIINYQEQPFIGAALRPWLGTGLTNAAVAGGEKLPGGYRVHFRLADAFGIQTPFSLENRDFIGLNLEVRDAAKDAAGVIQMTSYSTLSAQNARDQYANNMMILDLKNKISGDSLVNVHVFPHS